MPIFTLAHFFFFAILGLLIECLFTGLHSLIFDRNPRMVCTTYLPMGAIWGFGGMVLQLCHELFQGAWFVVASVFIIYTIEFSSGWIFQRIFGRKLWDYGNARFGVIGLIRLDYIFFWLLVGVGFDRLISVFSHLIGIIIHEGL